MYKIKEFSILVGVSVRMLRHYDKIGLLTPENINKSNNYRYYGEKNLNTIQQILFFKELDFSLSEIKEIINDKSFNAKEALNMQRNLLNLKKQRLENMIVFIDTLLKSKGAKNMSKLLKQTINNDAFNKQKLEYAKQAEQKWGSTDSYKQSQKRMAKYSKQDISELNKQQAKIYQELAKLMPLGITDSQVQEKVHQARMFITDYWYDCSVQQFANLGNMYVADQRFKSNIEQHGEGFTEFLNNAIQFYVSK